MTRIVYLHGFRSSSRSTKAALLQQAVAAMPAAARPPLWVPDLPHRPAEAIASEARPGDHVLVMSNGGFGGIHDKLLAQLA